MSCYQTLVDSDVRDDASALTTAKARLPLKTSSSWKLSFSRHEVKQLDSHHRVSLLHKADHSVSEAAGSAIVRPRYTHGKSARACCRGDDVSFMGLPQKGDRMAGQRPSTCSWPCIKVC